MANTTPILASVKNQLRLEADFTEQDEWLTTLISAAKRSIERDYYCTLVSTADELAQLPADVQGFITDEDIALAIQYLACDAYLNGQTGEWLQTAAVQSLLFVLMEHTV